MPSTTSTYYWRGFRDGLPFLLVISPFSLLFGVVATEAGLNVLEALSFSVVVIAGAAQFTALQLLRDDAPTVIVLLSALAVNVRMAMYSATLTPHLGGAKLWQRALAAYFLVDQIFALTSVKYEKEPDMTVSEKVAYFFGTVTPICPVWYLLTIVGALIGGAIPPEYALDFALPITFLAMIAPMLRTIPHIAAAATSVTFALLCAGLPLNLGLLVAGILGMMAGARAELWVVAARKEAAT